MEFISGIVGAFLICGGFFGLGVFFCRWIDDQKQAKRDKRLRDGRVFKSGQRCWPAQICESPLGEGSPPPRGQNYTYTLRKGVW